MTLKSLVAAATALSLVTAPALAAPAALSVEPAAETIEGEALYRTGILVPIAAAIALALVVYLLVDAVGGGDDEPASP